MDNTLHLDPRDPASWLGPSLEVCLRPDVADVQKLDAIADDTLRCFGIEGPFADVEAMDRDAPEGPWQWKPAIGLWLLADVGSVGVEISVRGDHEILILMHGSDINRLFPPFPWCAVGWKPSEANVRLHEVLIQKIREVGKVVPLIGAVIQDETWLDGLGNREGVILLCNELVERFGGVAEGDRFTSPIPP